MAVLVLGAAGGIGSALCRRLASEQVKLVVAGRDAACVGAIATEIGATPFVLDATRPAEVKAAAAKGGRARRPPRRRARDAARARVGRAGQGQA